MKQIKRIPVTKQISDSIKDSIIEGKFAIGEKLPTEQKLCDVLGVSRSSLREALKELQAQGFIELKVGKGAFVSDNEPHDYESLRQWFKEAAPTLEEYTQVRVVIEPQIASEAAYRGTPEEKQQLLNIHESFVKAEKIGNTSQMANIDEKFHTYIFKMAKNSVFKQINEFLNVGLRPYRIRSIALKTTSKNTVEEHYKICLAINNGNGKEAKIAMENHLKKSKSEIQYIASSYNPEQPKD
ncbi:MAG: FadR/GntR family transcriptional regulator [Sphaerochaeta sp.]